METYYPTLLDRVLNAIWGALLACFPLIHFFVGLGMVTGTFDDVPGEAQVFGVGLMIFAGLFILSGWALAVAVMFAGRNLAARTGYLCCLVVAGIECMVMPFGTVLGVFTIVVLMRESVKELFDASGSADPIPSTHSADRPT